MVRKWKKHKQMAQFFNSLIFSMKQLLILFYIFLSFTLQAQNALQVVKKSFNDGLPEIVHIYNNSEVEENLTQILHYNRDGQITYSAAYQNGLQHGKTLHYDSYDLRVSKDLNYINGQLNGIQVGYFRENEKRFEYFYKNGKLDGTQREWYSGGSQKSEWKLENGVLNGIQKSWNSYNAESKERIFDNGFFTESEFGSDKRLLEKNVYKTNVIVEDFKIDFDKKRSEEYFYYKNGKLERHTVFGDVKTIAHYYENGNAKSKEQFKEYSKTGDWSFWYENGKLKESGQYQENKKTGEWEFWSEDGTKSEVKTFQNNIPQGAYSAWHSNGKLKEQGEYTENKKSGQWSFWYENGTKSAEGGFEANKKTGNWTNWNENGQQETFGAYKKDRKDGAWQYFNQKNQLTEERTYKYGEQKGWKVFFYGNDGKILKTGYLDKNGNKAIKWEYWFEDGTKKRIENYKLGSYHNSRPFINDFEEWYHDGQLKQKGDDKKFVEYVYYQKDNIRTEKHFIQNKNHKRYEYYENGEIKKQLTAQRNEGGNMITREVIENMLAQEINYYENGNKKSHQYYCTNCKYVPAEALKELNNTIGKICRTCPAYTRAYSNLEEPLYDIKQGEYNEWYEDGQLRIKLSYDNNCLNGTQQEWYPSGEPMLQVFVNNQHPYTKKVIDSESCKVFLSSGGYYNSKGKMLVYKQEYTTKSIQKAGKENDVSLLEPVKKSKKILEIEAQSYFITTYFNK